MKYSEGGDVRETIVNKEEKGKKIKLDTYLRYLMS